MKAEKEFYKSKIKFKDRINMIFFEENDKCEFVNLVRYRNWIEQEKLVELYAELNRIILNNDSKKIGPLISCTHIVRKIGRKLQ